MATEVASRVESPDGAAPAGGRGWWALVLGAALAGVAFTGIQIVEKVAILKDPTTSLLCDVNSVMSCSGVLNAWQSSVLGPPNSLIGAVMFSVLASAGLGGVLRSRPSKAYLAVLWGLAVFFLGFASWFMQQTAFAIGYLCLWCTGIVTAVVLICAALTRLADRAGAFGSGGLGRGVGVLVRSGTDLIVWAGWWLAIAALLVIGLST